MIDLWTALPVLFGDNIGTTITAVLAAIGASIAAKRAAAVHVIFNVWVPSSLCWPYLSSIMLFFGWLISRGRAS